ncbi:hypothetical protein BYT27DRAFT_6501975 [Phlegmacium glaucopus]|nr:hypothetical protein BYT27DRAFT_6501975 [Phlegmacium glaucopus]
MSVPINIIKVFPPPSLLPTSLSPLSESFIINTPKSDASHPSVMASLSGNLDDYDREETSDPPGWIFSATSKSSHRDRYHGVEERLSELEKEFQVLKKEVRVLRADKDRNEFFLIRSQLYTKLLSTI